MICNADVVFTRHFGQRAATRGGFSWRRLLEDIAIWRDEAERHAPDRVVGRLHPGGPWVACRWRKHPKWGGQLVFLTLLEPSMKPRGVAAELSHLIDVDEIRKAREDVA